MQHTKIEWTDYVWNPIKGLCPQSCWYCYARKIYNRFKINPIPKLDDIEVFAPINSLIQRFRNFKPSRIFVCSTFELFHPTVDKWRDLIFENIMLDEVDTFIILTKLPQNIDRPMPNNVWLGVSITERNELWRWYNIKQRLQAKIKFISFEPFFESIPVEDILYCVDRLNWVIVGRLTGHGQKYNPKKKWIEDIVYWMKQYNIPIFLKNNLRKIWGEELIQEFPYLKEN